MWCLAWPYVPLWHLCFLLQTREAAASADSETLTYASVTSYGARQTPCACPRLQSTLPQNGLLSVTWVTCLLRCLCLRFGHGERAPGGSPAPSLWVGVHLPGSARSKSVTSEFLLGVLFHLISDFLVEDPDPVSGI